MNYSTQGIQQLKASFLELTGYKATMNNVFYLATHGLNKALFKAFLIDMANLRVDARSKQFWAILLTRLSAQLKASKQDDNHDRIKESANNHYQVNSQKYSKNHICNQRNREYFEHDNGIYVSHLSNAIDINSKFRIGSTYIGSVSYLQDLFKHNTVASMAQTYPLALIGYICNRHLTKLSS